MPKKIKIQNQDQVQAKNLARKKVGDNSPKLIEKPAINKKDQIDLYAIDFS